MASDDNALVSVAIDDVEKTAYFRPIETEAECDEAVRVLNALLDLPESSEGVPLAILLVALGKFTGDYEDARHRRPDEPTSPA